MQNTYKIMQKIPKRTYNKVLDKLHRGFVMTCMGVTLYGFTAFGIQMFHYFTKIKPQKKLLEKETLLAEGSSENL